MSVKNNFVYSVQFLDAQQASLSSERMATYITRTGGNRENAARLYTWNVAASAAFYGPLQGLEIALRNAIHREMTIEFGGNWYDNPRCGLDGRTLATINSAKTDLIRSGYAVDPPHMVAALTFGFWVALLGSGGRLSNGAKANYEMTLWRPALYRAFCYTKVSRKGAHLPLDYLRTLRNRIAHHEPIFNRHLARDYASILTTAAAICPDTANWIAHHSRVGEILSQSPNDPALMF